MEARQRRPEQRHRQAEGHAAEGVADRLDRLDGAQPAQLMTAQRLERGLIDTWSRPAATTAARADPERAPAHRAGNHRPVGRAVVRSRRCCSSSSRRMAMVAPETKLCEPNSAATSTAGMNHSLMNIAPSEDAVPASACP